MTPTATPTATNEAAKFEIESIPHPTIETLKADLDRTILQMNRMNMDHEEKSREIWLWRRDTAIVRDNFIAKANAYKESLVERQDFPGAAAVRHVVDLFKKELPRLRYPNPEAEHPAAPTAPAPAPSQTTCLCGRCAKECGYDWKERIGGTFLPVTACQSCGKICQLGEYKIAKPAPSQDAGKIPSEHYERPSESDGGAMSNEERIAIWNELADIISRIDDWENLTLAREARLKDRAEKLWRQFPEVKRFTRYEDIAWQVRDQQRKEPILKDKPQ